MEASINGKGPACFTTVNGSYFEGSFMKPTYPGIVTKALTEQETLQQIKILEDEKNKH